MTDPALLVAVVDDEDDVRQALCRLLRSAGFDVLAYGSGAEFLSHAVGSAPDCVVLDLRMPGSNGFDVQHSLVEQSLAVPVIMMTGNASEDSRRQAIENGADAYLPKPVDGDTLIHAVMTAIERRRNKDRTSTLPIATGIP